MIEKVSVLAMMHRKHLLETLNYLWDNKAAAVAFLRETQDAGELSDDALLVRALRATAADQAKGWLIMTKTPDSRFAFVHTAMISTVAAMEKHAIEFGTVPI